MLRKANKKDESVFEPDAIQELLEQVPPAYQKRFLELVESVDQFCDQHLNNEYKEVARLMAGNLCQAGSPVLRGKVASWTAGVMYAVGHVNFLTDPSAKPHMTAKEIAAGAGVSESNMHAKFAVVRNGLDLSRFDMNFTVTSRMDDNPMIWILKVNGYLMDIRDAPYDAQVVAFENGLIPYVPGERKHQTAD